MANDDASFEMRGLRADSDQNDRSGQDGDRGCRMHRDTQRAMVGVGFNRMDVSDLNDNQQSQQRQTHQGHGSESRCSRATEVLLKPDQMAIPYQRIHRLGRGREESVAFSAVCGRTPARRKGCAV